MDLADKGIPVKIVSLGHRSGAVIMVRNDSPYQHFRISAASASPSRAVSPWISCSSDACSRRKTCAWKSIEIVEMAPPDMPAALYASAVDAYCTGEPFGAAAQSAGYARPLRMTRDEWPKYIVLRVDGAGGAHQRKPRDGAGSRSTRSSARATGSTRIPPTARKPCRSPRGRPSSTRTRRSSAS